MVNENVKEDNTTGEQASPNDIKKVATPSKNNMEKDIDKPKPDTPGFDLSNIPTKLRISSKTNGESGMIIDMNEIDKKKKKQIETADNAVKASMDKPRYHSITIDETGKTFILQNLDVSGTTDMEIVGG